MPGKQLSSGQGIIALGARLTNYNDLSRESVATISNKPCIVALRMDGFPACVYYENTVHGGIWRSSTVEKVLYLHEPGKGAKLEIHTAHSDFGNMEMSNTDSMSMTTEAFMRLTERQQQKIIWSLCKNIQSKYFSEVTAGLPPEVVARYTSQFASHSAMPAMMGRNQVNHSTPAEKLLFEAKKAVAITGLDPTAEVEYMIGIANDRKLVSESELSSGTPGSSIGGIVLM